MSYKPRKRTLYDYVRPSKTVSRKVRQPRVVSDYDVQIGTIRKGLKKLCPTLSVRRGSGTAYGWIDVWGSGDEFRNFTDEEKRALQKFGLNYGGNCAVISPDAREYYVEKARKSLGPGVKE